MSVSRDDKARKATEYAVNTYQQSDQALIGRPLHPDDEAKDECNDSVDQKPK